MPSRPSFPFLFFVIFAMIFVSWTTAFSTAPEAPGLASSPSGSTSSSSSDSDNTLTLLLTTLPLPGSTILFGRCSRDPNF